MLRVPRRFWQVGIFAFALPTAIFYVSTLLYVLSRMAGSGLSAADCGIVFGTAVWPVYAEDGSTVISSVPGPGIERRVSTAVHLFEQGRLHRLFLTGGRGEGNRRSEAQVMRDFAVSLGVPPERIVIEDRSRSTWENLLNTRPLTSDCESVVAISDAYHLARIGLQAHVQGWNLTTYPAEESPSWVFTARSSLREAIGIDLLVLIQLLT